jgi:hypothetical protein
VATDAMTRRTRFPFIHFAQSGPEWFCCRNNKTGVELGTVTWYKPWGQWVFEASGTAVFSADCLADVRTFILSLGGKP